MTPFWEISVFLLSLSAVLRWRYLYTQQQLPGTVDLVLAVFSVVMTPVAAASLGLL